MRKLFSFLMVNIIVFNTIVPFVPLTVEAAEAPFTNNRNMCSASVSSPIKYELAKASSTSMTTVACYNTFNEAKTAMNSTSGTESSIPSIIETTYQDNGAGSKIVATKYGVVDLGTKYSSRYNTNIYTTSSLSTTSTYVNGYYGAEAALIDVTFSSMTERIEILVETLNIRADHSTSSVASPTPARRGFSYTIFDTFADTENNYTWYKIKTGSSSYGWIASEKDKGWTKKASIYSAKIKISGAEGYIGNSLFYSNNSYISQYEVNPYNMIDIKTYYKKSSTSGNLTHYYHQKVSTSTWATTIDKAPDFFLADTKYLSYDGNYFYDGYIKMIDDYRSGVVSGAVNLTEPYYNYYQYLPNRTKTNYSASELNFYTESVRGFTGKPSYENLRETNSDSIGDNDGICEEGEVCYISGSIPSNLSQLYQEGANYIDAQNKYGANAMLTFGVSANESGWGRSLISILKNNIFGHGATDSNAVGGASVYPDVKTSIAYHAQYWVNFGYVDPNDSRYNGPHYGNKGSGLGVKYASDPYWGEKMAGIYYSIDSANGNLDRDNPYTIAIKNNTDTVNIRKEATTNSDVLYQLPNIKNIPVVILGEVTGEKVNGSTLWYKIQSDAPLDATRNPITSVANVTYDADGNAVIAPTYYDFDRSYAFVHSSVLDSANIYREMEGLFYFNDLEWDNTSQKLNFSGFLTIKGINNKSTTPIAYSLILTDKNTDEQIVLPVDRWLDGTKPLAVPSENGFDYTASWFKGDIDLNNIPEGDYTAEVRARAAGYETITPLKNLFSVGITRSITDSNERGYLFRTDYYSKDVPLEIFVRDDGLLANSELPTIDNKFNIYYTMGFDEGNLNILGASYNVGGNYATTIDVTRSLTLENIETFKRYTYDVGAITNGPVPISLRVSDGKSKTKSWYNASIPLQEVEPGTYSILLATDDGSLKDFGELADIFSSSLSAPIDLGDKIASLSLNTSERYRIELTVTEKEIVNDTISMNWDGDSANISGYAYSKEASPTNLDIIDHNVILTAANDINTTYTIPTEAKNLCDIDDTICKNYNNFVGYAAIISFDEIIPILGDGEYILSIETTITDHDDYVENMENTIHGTNQLIRKQIADKLVTFIYGSHEVRVKIEPFTYEYDIIIDVGHSLNTGESVGTTSYDRLVREMDLNVTVSNYEKTRFVAHGLNVLVNRTTNTAPPLMMGDSDWQTLTKRAYALAYLAPRAKYVYSNHHNGSSPSVAGFEVIVPTGASLSDLSTEKKVYDAWKTISFASSHKSGYLTRDYDSGAFLTKINNEVYDYKNYYAVIRTPYELSDANVTIYEPAYMTNSSNFNWYYKSNNWVAMSELKIKEYVEALGGTYVAP